MQGPLFRGQTNAQLSEAGDPLEKLNSVVPWDLFRKPLFKALKRSDDSKGGRPAYDPVLMFWRDEVDASASGIIMPYCGCQRSQSGEPSMKEVITVGLDIAKHVFQVHGVDQNGDTLLRRKLRRSVVVSLFDELPPCLIGIEARAAAHH